MEDEAQVRGWRSWPNLLIGVVDMWLHPVVWPADSGSQRRQRAAALAFVVGLGGWLFGHVAVEVSMLPAGLVHSWRLNLSDVLLLAGLIVVVPLPLPSWTALLRLMWRITRKLIVPVLLAAAVLVGAQYPGATEPTPRMVLLTAWWTALVLGAVQVCQVIAELDADVVISPPPLRLRLGVGLLTAAFAYAAVIILWSTMTIDGPILLPITIGGALLMLTALCGGTLRDLYAVTVAD
jgi:hypothetical protein